MRRRLGRAGLTLAVVAGCRTSEVELLAPPPPPTFAVVLRIQPDKEDSAAAQPLSWGGVIPGAEVTVTPGDSSQPPRTGQSGVDGLVRFDDLPRGDYQIAVRRALTDTERARVAAAGVVGWIATTSKILEPSATPVAVAAAASRRGSLAVSEWSYNSAFPAGQNNYDYHSYVELYNATDSTIYLDGVIVGRGFAWGFDYPSFPCSDVAQFATDSLGVWSTWFQRFPGTGHDYPVAPGKTVLVATDAIDHRPLGGPDTPDLSHADFEFVGTVDVDNPAVPNMIDVGTRVSRFHGIPWNPLWSVIFVARPIDLASLAKARPQNSEQDYLRFPTSHLLDVVSQFTSWTGAEYPSCPRIISQALDKSPARGMGADEVADVAYSFQRVKFGTAPLTLQDTRNSGVDFARLLRTPGVP